MNVRGGRVEDAERIAAIHVRAWQVAYRGIVPQQVLDNLSAAKRQAFWEPRLASNEPDVLVAAIGAEIVGWLAFGASRDDDARADVVEIYGLYVDPSAWRKGVGRRLLDTLMLRIAGTSADEITLWVLVGNDRARSFYEAMGFACDGRTRTEERNGAVLDEIRYRMRLPERGE